MLPCFGACVEPQGRTVGNIRFWNLRATDLPLGGRRQPSHPTGQHLIHHTGAWKSPFGLQPTRTFNCSSGFLAQPQKRFVRKPPTKAMSVHRGVDGGRRRGAACCEFLNRAPWRSRRSSCAGRPWGKGDRRRRPMAGTVVFWEPRSARWRLPAWSCVCFRA